MNRIQQGEQMAATTPRPVEIRQVLNGYIVRPITYPGEAAFDDDCRVFQSMYELKCWLAEHFTHTAGNIKSDFIPPP